jgi:Fe-S cluster biosynthesis and repair protein YggX
VTEDGEIIDVKPPSDPDLTRQLQASISKVEWDKWAAGHLIMIEEAQDKGMLNEAWAAVNESRRLLKDAGTPVPDIHYAALTKAKDQRKAALS